MNKSQLIKNNKQLYEKYESMLHSFASDADITRPLNCGLENWINTLALLTYYLENKILLSY